MSGWSIPIDKLAEKAKVETETIVRKITFDIFRGVVLKSPVLTGRFRANWNVSLGAPNYETSEATGQARTDGEVRKALGFKAGGTTYLTNGLPYARRLEYGYSQQAPAGMVRLTVADYLRNLERALK